MGIEDDVEREQERVSANPTVQPPDSNQIMALAIRNGLQRHGYVIPAHAVDAIVRDIHLVLGVNLFTAE